MIFYTLIYKNMTAEKTIICTVRIAMLDPQTYLAFSILNKIVIISTSSLKELFKHGIRY